MVRAVWGGCDGKPVYRSRKGWFAVARRGISTYLLFSLATFHLLGPAGLGPLWVISLFTMVLIPAVSREWQTGQTPYARTLSSVCPSQVPFVKDDRGILLPIAMGNRKRESFSLSQGSRLCTGCRQPGYAWVFLPEKVTCLPRYLQWQR